MKISSGLKKVTYTNSVIQFIKSLFTLSKDGKPYKDAHAPLHNDAGAGGAPPHFDTGAQLPYNGGAGPAAMSAYGQSNICV
jgi:hypothetical protein